MESAYALWGVAATGFLAIKLENNGEVKELQ
jgi:hypothetical protein